MRVICKKAREMRAARRGEDESSRRRLACSISPKVAHALPRSKTQSGRFFSLVERACEPANELASDVVVASHKRRFNQLSGRSGERAFWQARPLCARLCFGTVWPTSARARAGKPAACSLAGQSIGFGQAQSLVGERVESRDRQQRPASKQSEPVSLLASDHENCSLARSHFSWLLQRACARSVVATPIVRALWPAS